MQEKLKPKRTISFNNIDIELLEEQYIFYCDHLDIFIEDAFAPVKLTRDQHVIAREFGRCTDLKIVQSRGSGKTWLIALCCHAYCVLHPGTICIICSATAGQGALVLNKLKMMADQNKNIANELTANNARSLVQISGDKGRCTYKNGSQIISGPISSLLGQRAKIIVVDEVPTVDKETLDRVVSPILNYRREISFNYNFEDYESKSVNITSASEKTNAFYDEFMRVLRGMAKGDRKMFACALDYRAAAANEITPMSFFEAEKIKLPDPVFKREYGSIFMGANSNTAFPYSLVETCRTLKSVELKQPKNSKSFYIISVDIATSDAKGSDNTIISVIKYTERADGSFSKKLVYMRSLNGEKLDYLAEEVRKLYHLRFPNTQKIVYDARGLGDSFDRFFDNSWIAPNGQEYPPLVVDDTDTPQAKGPNAILHPFRAVQQLNQRMYSNTRVGLEQRMVEIPVSHRIIKQDMQENGARQYTDEELAIFIEADALQFEMGNIVEKKTNAGNYTYDTPRAGLHKDRYSSFAMGLDYICELEKENIKRHKHGSLFIGDAFDFD